jgi:hypothetical protein
MMSGVLGDMIAGGEQGAGERRRPEMDGLSPKDRFEG